MAGKLDTRQKMINMMYLVFIAMLALNIGKEVLATLGVLTDELEVSTNQVEQSSQKLYSNIAGNVEASPNYVIPAVQVLKLKKIADEFDEFIQIIKDQLVVDNKDSGEIIPGSNKFEKTVITKNKTKDTVTKMQYQKMDKAELLNIIFFKGSTKSTTYSGVPEPKEGDRYTVRGEEYIAKFKNFPNSVMEILRDLELMEIESKVAQTKLDGFKEKDGIEVNYNFDQVNSDASGRFQYSEKVVKEDGKEQDYLEANFLDFPVVASISKLTKVQNDIRYIENQVLKQISSALGGGDGDLDTFITFITAGKTNKTSFYESEVVDAAVVMGKNDPSFVPHEVELYINKDGQSEKTKLTDDEWSLDKGMVVLNKTFRNEGTYKLTGFIYKKNNISLEIQKIVVASDIIITKKSNTVVVSADNMRVFYRGLRNPISIGEVQGINANTMRPSSPDANISRSGSGWLVQPTNATAETIVINVSGTLDGVNTRLRSGEVWTLKSPPPGEASMSVFGESYKNLARIEKDLAINGRVKGTKPSDFLYKYDIIIDGFSVKVDDLTEKRVNGNSISRSAGASSDVDSAGRGSTIVISNIRASTKDGNVITPNYPVADIILILQ